MKSRFSWILLYVVSVPGSLAEQLKQVLAERERKLSSGSSEQNNPANVSNALAEEIRIAVNQANAKGKGSFFIHLTYLFYIVFLAYLILAVPEATPELQISSVSHLSGQNTIRSRFNQAVEFHFSFQTMFSSNCVFAKRSTLSCSGITFPFPFKFDWNTSYLKCSAEHVTTKK